MEHRRDYYLLMHDANRDDLEVVDDYEMDGFDLTTLWTGEKLEGGIPETVKIYVDDGLRSDYLGNPLSWLLFSPRLVRLVEPLCKSSVQFVPVRLFRVRTHKPIRHYLLVNPLGCVNAIPAKKRKNINIQHLELNSKSIPQDRHLFRLKYHPNLIVFSQEVFDALRNKGLQGVAARKLNSV